MKMRPREYQKEALSTLEKKRANNEHSALVVMATGLGKTAVAAFDVGKYMKNNRGKLLFLCHNNDILTQNQEMFKDFLDGEFSYGLYNGIEKIPEAEFLFASFQTMSTHKREFKKDEFSYIVVDEAHHAPADTYREVIRYFKPDFLLGLTATPNRLDGLSLEDTFGPITYSLGLIPAIRRDLLANIDYHLVLDEMADLDSISVDGQKFSMNELNKRLFIPKRDEEIAKILLEKNSNNGSMLVFCCSIEHAEAMHSLLPGSRVVHSKRANKENEKALRMFRDGELSILISVDKLNEGVDIPRADTLVFLRSTASPTIFYQQLGRGLRLHEGKKRATVLDFVGNVERLTMVANLQKEISEHSPAADNDLVDDNEYFVLNIDAKQFHNREINIIDILDKIDYLSWGYSDEELIEQVQMLAKELGRTPSMKDFDKDPRTASCSTIERKFGSWNKFLEAAGLETNLNISSDTSRDGLIRQVQMLAKELGRTPSTRDFNKDPRTASSYTAEKRFGSWNKFLEAAGLETNLNISSDTSRDGLIRQVQMLARELGRTPSMRDFNKDPRTANSTVAKNRFGSWNKFLEVAGLEVNKRSGVSSSASRDGLIQQVQMLAKELGRTPFMKDFNKNPGTASCSTIERKFGSWNKFLEAAGLEVNITYSNFSKDELIRQVQMLAKELGRTPSTKYFDKDPRTASSKPVVNRFGSWNKFLEAAGLEVNRKKK